MKAEPGQARAAGRTARWAMLAALAMSGAPALAVNINNPYLDRYHGGVLGDYYDRAGLMPNVVAIFVDIPGEGLGQNCTGTLINARTVLTAAHCVADGSNQVVQSNVESTRLRFSSDPMNVASPHDRAIRDLVFHADYFGNAHRDLALITLDRPVRGLAPVQLAPAGYALTHGQLATIVGYGLAGTGTEPGRPADPAWPRLPGYDDARRRIAVTQIGQVDPLTGRIRAQFRDPLSPDDPNVYGLTGPVPEMHGEPEGGDSGGPLFVWSGQGWLQVGTVIGGGGGLYGGAGYGSTDSWTYLPMYADWLQQNVAGLLADVSARPVPGGRRAWSDAAAWAGGVAPQNVRGRLDGGSWLRGTYYAVTADAPSHVVVDQAVEIDSLDLRHRHATVEIAAGQTLFTALDTTLEAGALSVDGTLDSYDLYLRGGRLSGTGTVALLSSLWQTGGTLAPGHSPGVLTVDGNLLQGPGARLEIDIDGPAAGNGAGHHGQLRVRRGLYLADGVLSVGLSGGYQPQLGQGFDIVQAEAGVLGGYAGVDQPVSATLRGMRFDVAYRPQGIRAYATPASYAGLAAAGVADSDNRRRLGQVLDLRRPLAGTRIDDPRLASLYSSLAPQTAATLPRIMDQLGGVAYAQVFQASAEHHRFLSGQIDDALAAQRRGQPLSSLGEAGGAAAGAGGPGGSQAWFNAVAQGSVQSADANGYRTRGTLKGLAGGMQRRLDGGWTVGYALGYADSSLKVASGMGQGQLRQGQLALYAQRELDHGLFVQAQAGVGLGRLRLERQVGLTGLRHEASIRTRSVNAGGLVGWASGPADAARLELTLGLRYQGVHHAGFRDGPATALSTLDIEGGTQHSLASTLGLGGSVPWRSGKTDWLASAWAGWSHEFARPEARMNAQWLGLSFMQASSRGGRDRLQAGLGLSAQAGPRTRFVLQLAGEAGRGWRAGQASAGVRIAF